MNTKLSILKNIIWAVCIAIMLFALLVGFAFGAFRKNSGQQEDGILYLAGKPQAENPAAEQMGQDLQAASSGLVGDGSLKTLGETADAGQEYIDSLTFLCDSALIPMREYAMLSGGTANTQVWGSSAGNIPASELGSFTVKYPVDGSIISPAEAARLAQPAILVISLGMDGLDSCTKEQFISGYKQLLQDIYSASPDTRLVCLSLTSVIPGYVGTDMLTSDKVMEVEEWIQQVCIETGAYYCDAGAAVTDSGTSLLGEYASSNGKALNNAGINKVLEYLRLHALSE